jgi:RHS repeat-associated protein
MENGFLLTEFAYDDRGFRIMKKERAEGGNFKEEWFVRDASGNIMGIYHKTTGQNLLAQIELPIYGSGKIGNAYRQPDHLNFNYELTDHLGNVRTTFSNVQLMAMASMELDRDDHENQYFDNLHTRHIDPLMAYQWQYSARLFAGAPIGPSITTPVKAGAALKLEVKAKYLEPQGGFDPNILTSGIMGLITNNLNTGAIGEAGVMAGIVDNLNTELAATALVNTQNAIAPKAYLQYILFDDAYEVVDHGYTLVSDAANGTHETLTLTADIESDGYLYAYLVNESEIDVHFDNFMVSVSGMQVQSRTEYYPFGYVLSEWKHGDADLYRYGYQGQFAERDTVTQWNHFELREWDSRIGRWLITDPYRQYASPYVGMGNNPVNLIDPDGGFTQEGTDAAPAADVDCCRDFLKFLQMVTGIGLQDDVDPLYKIFFKPVAYTVGPDLDIVAIIGTDVSPFAIGEILRGPDAGRGFVVADAGVGYGIDISMSAEGTVYFYTGDINKFTISSLNGKRIEANLGVALKGFDLGGGLSVSEEDQYGGRVIGIKGFIGTGVPTVISGNINWGEATVVKPLH